MPISDCGGKYGDIGRQRRPTSIQHLPRAFHALHLHASRVRHRDRPAYQRYPRTQLRQRRGDCVALPPA